MRIKKLLKDLDVTIQGNRELEVNGLNSDSRLIAPGNLFVAKKGLTVDGTHFIPGAIAGGATAILTDYYDPSLKGITQIIHPDVTKIEGIIADRYYGSPSKELFTIGITGTNGKTTTAWITQKLLELHGEACGMIGTLGYFVGERVYDATHTTPEVIRCHRLLREMCRNGCKSAVLEATSHALDQGRLLEVDFDIAVFTNLTLDHLDYHIDFTHYRAAKKRLFDDLRIKGSVALVNGDDPEHKNMLANCRAKPILYGLNQECDLKATDCVLSSKGTEFKISWKGKTATVFSPLLGHHNIYNTLAAIGTALHKKLSLSEIISALPSIPQVPGRMEKLDLDLPFSVVVDFAHTPSALEAATQTLKMLTKGRVITVFGCGGNRDQSKRPLMAQAAENNSAFCIVTSDNPRNESPEEICSQVISGFQSPENHLYILDRKEAIKTALEMAKAHDTILIAGRGHESTQLIGNQFHPFCDRQVAIDLTQNILRGAL